MSKCERKESSNTTSSSATASCLRKKSNLIIRGTSLLFDEIQVAREEENQIKSLDEIEEENDDNSNR